jgi:hypothetical protein
VVDRTPSAGPQYTDMCHSRDVGMDSTPVLEPISIDEALQDERGLGHLIGPPETIGRRIKEGICTTDGLSVSVGIGPNRGVARVALDVGTPAGLIVVAPGQTLEVLGAQPVALLRGVGRRTRPPLERLDLRTVALGLHLSLRQLQPQLGSRVATRLDQRAWARYRPRGGGCRPPVACQGDRMLATPPLGDRRARPRGASPAGSLRRQCTTLLGQRASVVSHGDGRPDPRAHWLSRAGA